MEKKEKSSILTIIIVAVVVAVISSVTTLFIAKKFIFNNGTNNNIVGTWYSAYGGQTFLVTLRDDKTFELGYENSEMTTGKYSNTSDVIKLTTSSGVNNLVYEMGKDYIEIDSKKFYPTKEEATKNDLYFFVPDDYDISMFTKITAEEMVKKFNKGEEAFVLTARGSCGYCQQFRPVAAESVKKYNYTLYYLDTTTLKEENYTQIRALDSKFNDFGSTPNVYYFKGKAIVDIQQGAADANTYGSFLERNGVKEK